MISKIDFIGVPSQDAERSRRFYVETLGLRPDERAQFEFWAGDTCFGIWEPEKMGMEFAPQKNAHPALHVEDVAAARAELEAKGVEFTADVRAESWGLVTAIAVPGGGELGLYEPRHPTAV